MKKNHALFVTRPAGDSAAPLVRGVAVSSTTAYYSKPISGSIEATFQLSWTGTPTGVWVLQASEKDQPDETSDTDWYTVTATTAPTAPAGSPSSTFGKINDHNSKWKRLKYTNATGSGVIFGDVSVGEQM